MLVCNRHRSMEIGWPAVSGERVALRQRQVRRGHQINPAAALKSTCADLRARVVR
jgi:hypothetical protein